MPRTPTQNPKTLSRDSLPRFLGVNLRNDPQSIQDDDVVAAINMDFHTLIGVARVRNGSASVASGLAGPVRNITRAAGRVFVVAGDTLYRDVSTSMETVDNTGEVSINEYTPLGDDRASAFVSTRSDLRRIPSGSTLSFPWGIAPPPIAPTLSTSAVGALTGNYSIVYTYARKVGTALVHESNPSPFGFIAVSSQGILATATASTDSQVTNIRFYRTQANGALPLFVTEIANASTQVALSILDIELGAAVEVDNNPPNPGEFAAVHRNRIFIADDLTVAWSKAFKPEAFPALNTVDIGSRDEKITKVLSFNNQLVVFTRYNKYRLIEQVGGVEAIGGPDMPFFGGPTTSFIPVEAGSARGSDASRAIVGTRQFIVFPARDGVFVTNIAGADERITASIEPLFYGETVNDIEPITWNHPQNMSGVFYKGRYYFSYMTDGGLVPDRTAVYSFDSQRWYFYDITPTYMYHDIQDDRLYRGDNEGAIFEFEKPGSTGDNSTAITWSFQTKTSNGADFALLKLYQYLKIDFDTAMTVEFYVDDALKTTLSLVATDSKKLIRLPQGTLGHEWYAIIKGTDTTMPSVLQMEVLWKPLMVA